jgi:hypothetical protein
MCQQQQPASLSCPASKHNHPRCWQKSATTATRRGASQQNIAKLPELFLTVLSGAAPVEKKSPGAGTRDLRGKVYERVQLDFLL